MTTTEAFPGSNPTSPRTPRPGVRVPQLLLSLLVVAVFALLAVWWQANSNARVAAIALAADVEIGAPLERSDLTVVYISSDVPTRYEPSTFIDTFVGVAPVTDLEAGTVITASMFRRSTPVGPGEGLIGLRLAPDEAPSSLAPGDSVHVIGGRGDGDVTVLSRDARVEAVTPTGSDGTVLVRLRLPIEQAHAAQLSAGELVVVEVASPDRSAATAAESEAS